MKNFPWDYVEEVALNIMGGVQDNECLESEDLMMIVLFIVLFQNQTSNTFGEGTYSII